MKQLFVGLLVVVWLLVFHSVAFGIEHDSIGTGGTEQSTTTSLSGGSGSVIDYFSFILGILAGYAIKAINIFRKITRVFTGRHSRRQRYPYY
jgi:hypothetical protein